MVLGDAGVELRAWDLSGNDGVLEPQGPGVELTIREKLGGGHLVCGCEFACRVGSSQRVWFSLGKKF